MEARIKVFGHPVHQMLIVLPMGMLMGAVIFDLLHLLAGGVHWLTVSYWLIAAGAISGVVAAVFGVYDWAQIPKRTRARRIGAVHGIGNAIVVGLFAWSWMIRSFDPSTTPPALAFVMTFVAGTLAMVTGWLGGELVDRMGIGIDDGANLNAPSSLSRGTTGGRPRESHKRA